jgi:chorismate mutase
MPGLPSSCLLVELAAERLVLGVDVAVTKFATGDRIDDSVREQEILNWVQERLTGTGPRMAIGLAFFSDQIEASKVVQRGLHARWRDYPQEVPRLSRDLAAEIRPELDVINEGMLSLLANLKGVPPLLRRCVDVFDIGLSGSPALASSAALRWAAARIALRSLRGTSAGEDGW